MRSFCQELSSWGGPGSGATYQLLFRSWELAQRLGGGGGGWGQSVWFSSGPLSRMPVASQLLGKVHLTGCDSSLVLRKGRGAWSQTELGTKAKWATSEHGNNDSCSAYSTKAEIDVKVLCKPRKIGNGAYPSCWHGHTGADRPVG